jgi:hypothetical protein
MPKSRRHSNKHRSRRYKRTKRGGMNTDELVKLEEGNKYGNVSVPYLMNPSTIPNPNPTTKLNRNTETAAEFFDKASKGAKEKAELERKYTELQAYNKSRENPMTAADLFSRPRTDNKGGRKTKRRRGRKIKRRTRRHYTDQKEK